VLTAAIPEDDRGSRSAHSAISACNLRYRCAAGAKLTQGRRLKTDPPERGTPRRRASICEIARMLKGQAQSQNCIFQSMNALRRTPACQSLRHSPPKSRTGASGPERYSEQRWPFSFSYGISLVALGTLPGAADTGEQVVAWFREHRDGVRWSVWAMTVGMLPFAVMFALSLLPAPHRDVFLIGAIAVIVLYAVQAWTWGGLALHADRLEPATARTVLDVALFFGPVLTGGDDNHDGAGHLAGSAWSCGPAAVARRSGRGRLSGAGR